MTTGSIPYGTTLLDKTGSRFERIWSGTDGRTEVYAGSVRTKWNNFTLSTRRRNRLQKDYSYKRKPAYGGNVVVATLLVGEAQLFFTWSTNEELRLQSKLLKKIKSHDFNLAVNLAQTRQVTRMVDSNLRKLGRAALALRKGDFATAARSLGARPKTTRLKTSDVSGRWLELQYGWRPLINDTFEAMKAFESITQGPRSATVKVSISKRGRYSTAAGANVVLYDTDETYARRIQYEMYEEMSVQRQLGLLDPASVAWELIPWSFVADWFIPIGTYLENLNQIPKLRGRFMTTVFRKAVQPHSMRWASPLPAFFERGFYLPTMDKEEYVTLSRTVSSSLTVPFPKFKTSNALGGNRIFNAIALAQQAFSGGAIRRR